MTIATFPDHDQRFRLDGRTIFLSGAAGHLGRAMAIGLAQAGGHVILNGRTAATLEALADELNAAGLSASTVAFDVMDRAAADAFFAGLDRLDVLINNAISGLPKKDDASPDRLFEVTFASGVTAANGNVRAAIPALEAAVAAAGDASVINVASLYGRVSPRFSVYGDSGFTSGPHYGATKGGLLQLTRYLACELGPKGIRVNSLSPGIFPWDQVAVEHPGFVERASAQSPLGRTGRADELAGAAVFLAAPASTYMTGADLLIDGGWAAW